MNPKITTLEAGKKVSQAKLDTRRTFLKEKGLSGEAIRKDVVIRKLKLAIMILLNERKVEHPG